MDESGSTSKRRFTEEPVSNHTDNNGVQKTNGEATPSSKKSKSEAEVTQIPIIDKQAAADDNSAAPESFCRWLEARRARVTQQHPDFNLEEFDAVAKEMWSGLSKKSKKKWRAKQIPYSGSITYTTFGLFEAGILQCSLCKEFSLSPRDSAPKEMFSHYTSKHKELLPTESIVNCFFIGSPAQCIVCDYSGEDCDLHQKWIHLIHHHAEQLKKNMEKQPEHPDTVHSCMDCDDKFNKLKDLSNHFSSAHSEALPSTEIMRLAYQMRKCVYCGYYHDKDQAAHKKFHLLYKHKDEISDTEDLKRVRAEYVSSLEWGCSVCDVICSTQKNYDEHMTGRKHLVNQEKLNTDSGVSVQT